MRHFSLLFPALMLFLLAIPDVRAQDEIPYRGLDVRVLASGNLEDAPLEQSVQRTFQTYMELRGISRKGLQNRVLVVGVKSIPTDLGERVMLSIFEGDGIPEHAIKTGVEAGMSPLVGEEDINRSPDFDAVERQFSREWLGSFADLTTSTMELVDPGELNATITTFLDEYLKPGEVY